MIYSGGALTNIALAVRLDPDFARLAKGLVIMGGYLDVTLLTTSGSVLQADLNSDVSLATVVREKMWPIVQGRIQLLTNFQINLKIDPEGAKVALTADFPSITIVGNAANQVFPDQEYLDEVYEVKNGYTELFYNYYGTIVRLTLFAYTIYDGADTYSLPVPILGRDSPLLGLRP